MVSIHKGTTGDLLAKVVTPGREPVTLICRLLPVPEILDQAAIAAKGNGRSFRVITSLYGPGPVSTRYQLDSLIHLSNVGVKVKTAERGVLPSLLVVPPGWCCILPSDWGRGSSPWHRPVMVKGDKADDLFTMADRVWRRAGIYLSRRRLLTAGRWLEEVDSVEGQTVDSPGTEVGFGELTLFDKRRGRRRKSTKKDKKTWWTFHGTADGRVNPFLPVHIWANRKDSHKLIRFPSGRRPTGVSAGDDIFFVVLSRNAGGDNEAYIVGHGRALAYRPLIDDASDDETQADEFLTRYPHALRLERVVFIRGAIGEGIPAYGLMNKLGPRCFESTYRNLQKKSGNTDPHKSIAQKTLIRMSSAGAEETYSLLEDKLLRIGQITAEEISCYEPV